MKQEKTRNRLLEIANSAFEYIDKSDYYITNHEAHPEGKANRHLASNSDETITRDKKSALTRMRNMSSESPAYSPKDILGIL